MQSINDIRSSVDDSMFSDTCTCDYGFALHICFSVYMTNIEYEVTSITSTCIHETIKIAHTVIEETNTVTVSCLLAS